MSRPADLSHDARKGHVLKQVQTFNVDSLTDLWTCPFCQAPPLKLKVPAKDNQLLMDKLRRQISDHLQLHKQDVMDALSASEKQKAAVDREKRTMQWIDATMSERRSHTSTPQPPIPMTLKD